MGRSGEYQEETGGARGGVRGSGGPRGDERWQSSGSNSGAATANGTANRSLLATTPETAPKTRDGATNRWCVAREALTLKSQHERFASAYRAEPVDASTETVTTQQGRRFRSASLEWSRDLAVDSNGDMGCPVIRQTSDTGADGVT